MDRIQELLARLREPGDNPLSNDELAELLTLCRDRAGELREVERTPEVVTELRDLAAAVGEANTETTSRAEAQATLEAEADEALAAIDPPAEETPAEVEQTAETTEATPETVEEAPVTQPEAVAASARPTPAQAAQRIPAGRRPQPTADAPAANRVRTRLVASAEIPGFAQGSEITTEQQLGEATAERLRTLSKGRALVASLFSDYPEERKLGKDVQDNERKFRAAIDSNTLVASGGICAPLAVDYTIPVFSVADRPIKAGLAAFQADRGGVVFVTPPKLTDLANATGLWSEATDANPGDTTKPVLTVTCGATNTVYVDAIPTRLKFGNMQARYFPEQVAANTQYAIAYAARFAEQNLWDKIIASSTVATAPKYLGATRNLLSSIDLAAAAYRNRHRTGYNRMLRVVLHSLFKDMIRADLAREIGHAQSADFNSLAISDAQIDDWFAARNISPIWALDSYTAVTKNSVALVAQSFGSQTAGSVLTTWPASCTLTLFIEGTYQFLDGGRLDLGVVRDSFTDATNDYETFIETFESVAFRGVEADTVQVTLAPDGGSAGTVTPAEPSE